jgi:hypothetical protein
MFPMQLGFGYASVALGDMLILSGQRARGESLLRASLADMDHVAHDLRRGDIMYLIDRPTALALLGDRKAALAALHKAVSNGYLNTWEILPLEPAFDLFRSDPDFQNMMREMQTKKASEMQILGQLRASGQVPNRGARGIEHGPAATRPLPAS